ncbi:L-asparaginase [Hydrogenophilus thermoluteolus]|uniref:asparaginase n=1 Tax=Hydrogenophilus thermoluteolus TaxID=297 RepID=UPI0024A3A00D|nr:asparaginase [Hydrogenophilus thermoluteolus]GLW60260.1 L-asparaginase [Hydrogenophilus thermoluteolus]
MSSAPDFTSLVPPDATPHLAWIATGGTIAGAGVGHTYTAGAIAAETLAARWRLGLSLPVRVHTPYQIDSKEAAPKTWQQLHTAVSAALAAPGCRGILVTHGTDTLEESAALLALTLNPSVPIVLTGAMRPADDPKSDGEANFRAALALAVDAATPPGVWVAFAGKRFPALGVRKTHTCARDAFAAVEPLDASDASLPMPAPYAPASSRRGVDCSPSAPGLPLPLPTVWPSVPLLSCTAWDDVALLEAMVPAVPALVLLCPGHGSVPTRWYPAIRAATARGTHIIRASRCALGPVQPHPIDAELGTWPAGILSAAQARVAAALVTNATPVHDERRALWRAIAAGTVPYASCPAPHHAANPP